MGNERRYRFEFDDSGAVEEVLATSLGGNRYRLDEAPIFSDVAQYHDVIEAEQQPDEALRFLRVVEPSTYVTSRFLIAREAAGSSAFATLKQRIVDLGGQWNLAMGGYLIVNMPCNVSFDAASEVQAMLDEARKNRGAS